MKGQQMGVAERDEDENLEQEHLEQDPPADDPPNPDTETDPETDPNPDPEKGGEEDQEVVVSIGNEETPASEEEKAADRSPVIRDLRRRHRELARENAELKAKLGTGQPAAQGKPELPPKPKLADFDYDEEKYDQARDAWDSKKREADAWEENQRKAAEAQQKRVQAINEGYANSIKALGVKDYQEAEEEAAGALDQVQQSILKAGAANPAALVYALGKTPKKLAELASIKDPVKFAVAVGKLETEVKVTKRTSTKPAPETTVRSNTSSATTTSATLERLQAEADKTGDRTKVAAYLRKQQSAGK